MKNVQAGLRKTRRKIKKIKKQKAIIEEEMELLKNRTINENSQELIFILLNKIENLTDLEDS